MSEKLLIVEDDKKLNDGIRLALKNDAYFFYQCRTLQEAREILKKGRYHIGFIRCELAGWEWD